MKKKEKFYQILDNTINVNGVLKEKYTIVYYDNFGVEELREGYDSNVKIKDGYLPIHLTLEVPTEYENLNDSFKMGLLSGKTLNMKIIQSSKI